MKHGYSALALLISDLSSPKPHNAYPRVISRENHYYQAVRHHHPAGVAGFPSLALPAYPYDSRLDIDVVVLALMGPRAFFSLSCRFRAVSGVGPATEVVAPGGICPKDTRLLAAACESLEAAFLSFCCLNACDDGSLTESQSLICDIHFGLLWCFCGGAARTSGNRRERSSL